MDLLYDLATEILLHLPVQSVLRFRTVCKSWRDIIDSSTFRESHLQNQWKNNEDETLFLQFTERSTPLWWEMSLLNADNGILHKAFPALQEFFNNKIGNHLLVTEILLRLPVQSMLRFRRVCKSWGNIIDSSSFRVSYVQNLWKNNADRFPALQEFFNWNNLFVVGPVKGLICMASSIHMRISIVIYNPCLDKIKILPESPIWSSLGNEYRREDCIRNIGFGFDNVTKDYKLVQLLCSQEGPTLVEVYSGTANTWRTLVTDSTLDDELILFNILRIKSSTYTKSGSSSHWRAQRRTEHRDYTEYVILSFYMHNEVFKTISYPNLEDRDVDVLGSSVVFAKDDDSFALFVYTSDFRRLEVWELESRDNKRGWTHVRDINVKLFSPRGMTLWPGALWKRKGVILVKYCPEQRHEFIFYDYRTEKVRKSW
ncbi:hypothetical protein ACS0TY_026281 [Phlomoides rotata]